MGVARDALREAGEDWVVVLAEAGSLAHVSPEWAEQQWGQGLSADLPVWRVVLAANELRAEVVIDRIEGSVYAATMGVAN